MKVLINTLAGSKSYGLDTPESDHDTRGVFHDENFSSMVGLSTKNTHIKSNTDDGVLWEVIHFFNMLKKGNTQALEIIYSDEENHLQYDTLFIDHVYKNRNLFLNTESLCNSLLGYSFGEYKKTFEYHGSLGGKRKEHIDINGYSHKNAVQCLRLLKCGHWFLEDGIFYVNIEKKSKEFRDELFDIKTNPEKYSPEMIKDKITKLQSSFEYVSNHRDKSKDFKFKEDVAVDFIKKLINLEK